MKAESLPRQVLAQFRAMECVQPGDTVCCALSGGADSVCLLRCLLELQEELGISVTAVHVDHQLRGTESDRDRQFCGQLCASLGVSLEEYTVDVETHARQEHLSTELAARQCRYEAFSQVQADWIATAHTASDNLETLLHRLIRGSSLHGLTAIPPKNGRILRPLLTTTREQVEVYLAELGQAYVTDSTNLTDLYTRNRIRHRIVPELKQLNPSVERTAAHTITSLCREDDYMAQQAVAAYAQCHTNADTLEHLEQIHPALQMRCLAMLLEEHGFSYDAALLERLMALAVHGGRWNLSRHVYAAAKPGILWIETAPPEPLGEKALLKLGENQIFPGFILYASLIEAENHEKVENVHGKFANSCLDYDKIKGNIFLRLRQPGERIRLPGRAFTSSLKKVIQAKVPQGRRKTLHILADDDGIVFAEYIGAADCAVPDENTRRLLVVEIREEQNDA